MITDCAVLTSAPTDPQLAAKIAQLEASLAAVSAERDRAIAERDKLNLAIEALAGPAKRRGLPPKKTKSEIDSEPSAYQRCFCEMYP